MCICMCVLVGVYVHHMPVAAHGSQRTQDPSLHLEFQLVVSCLMRVFEPKPEKAVSALNCGATSPALQRRNKLKDKNKTYYRF